MSKDQRDLYIMQLSALLDKRRQKINELYIKLIRANLKILSLEQELAQLKGEQNATEQSDAEKQR